MSIKLGFRTPKGNHTFTFEPTQTLQDIQAKIAEETKIPQYQQKLLTGFPPRPLSASPTDQISSLFKSSDLIHVQIDATATQPHPQPFSNLADSIPHDLDEDAQLQLAISLSLAESQEPQSSEKLSTTAPSVAKQTTPSAPSFTSTPSPAGTGPAKATSAGAGGGRGSYVVRTIPDDNSCLFNAVGYALEGPGVLADTNTARRMRRLIADTILRHPDEYNHAILGRAPQDYATYIQHPDRWGGGIELSVLSRHYQVEIGVFDCETGRMSCFGEGCGYSQRVYLAYSGIHYDVIAQTRGTASASGARPSGEITKFSPTDTDAFTRVSALVVDLQRQGKFTNVNTFTLKCGQCGVRLKGEKDALEHAKATAHTDFAEYKP